MKIARCNISKTFGLLALLITQMCHADTTVAKLLVKEDPKPGDRPFVEFRARADGSHVFIILGRERDGKSQYSTVVGFYPGGDTVKEAFYSEGELVKHDIYSKNDDVFRAWVTEDQMRRAQFTVRHIETDGKKYIYPVQTCVSFARDIATAIDLDTGKSSPIEGPADPNLLFQPGFDVVVTPRQLLQQLKTHNSADTPITKAKAHEKQKAGEFSATRTQELRTLQTTPPPRPDDNPVGRDRLRSDPAGSGPGVGPDVPPDFEAEMQSHQK